MSKSSDRFYQLELRDRPALYGDIGSLLKIDGLIIAGSGGMAMLLLPSSSYKQEGADIQYIEEIVEMNLSLEEWSDFLQRSDVPELMMPGKAFHRKARYEISGHVQQKVWKADGFACVYCNRPMGEVQLTIDHFIPLELGGENNTKNYLSACRKCNKDKGNTHPSKWCDPQKFLELQHYLVKRVIA